MRCILAVLLLVSSADAIAATEPDPRWTQQAQKPGITTLQKQAYEQIAELRNFSGAGMIPEGFYILPADKVTTKSCVLVLYEMGLDVLPVLVEALDDTTPSGFVTNNRWGTAPQTWQVNELTARLIVEIAKHDFVLKDSSHERLLSGQIRQNSALVPKFQKQVLEWHARNRHRALEDRIIADLGDNWFRNRMDAIEWLGEHKVLKASPVIIQHVRQILAARENLSVVDFELAESALALGRIGDPAGLPAVRRVCRHFGNGIREYGVTGSMDIKLLFEAQEGRALLGEKTESLQELQSLYAQCENRMESSSRKEYQERMQAAAKW